MAQSRKAIRKAIASKLGTPVQVAPGPPPVMAYPTNARERVYQSRDWPWLTCELPAMSVYALEESTEEFQTAPRRLRHRLQVVIEAAVDASAGQVDDALDDLATQIRRAFHADETFGGACDDSILESEALALFDEGERDTGLLRTVYSVQYFTYAPEGEDVTLDDFATAHMRWVKLDGETTIHVDNQAQHTATGLDEE